MPRGVYKRTKKRVVSEETKEKLRRANIGKKLSDEHKKKIGYSNRGQKRKSLSDEHRLKISIGNKGKKVSDNFRMLMSKIHKGKYVSEETRKKISIANKGKTNHFKGKKRPENSGKHNHCWKGDDASYVAKHIWIRKNKSISDVCEHCKKKKSPKELDAANISGEHKRDIHDYIWLCKKCHSKFDGLSEIQKIRHVEGRNITAFKKGNIPWNKGVTMKG
jgi:hypothetical protein